MRKIISRLFFVVLICSGVALAWTPGVGRLGTIQVFPDGTVRVEFLSTLSNRGMCGSVVNGTTQIGEIKIGQGGVLADDIKNMLGVLVSAKLSDQKVRFETLSGTAAQFGCLIKSVELVE